jgi:hypothetical protein
MIKEWTYKIKVLAVNKNLKLAIRGHQNQSKFKKVRVSITYLAERLIISGTILWLQLDQSWYHNP